MNEAGNDCNQGADAEQVETVPKKMATHAVTLDPSTVSHSSFRNLGKRLIRRYTRLPPVVVGGLFAVVVTFLLSITYGMVYRIPASDRHLHVAALLLGLTGTLILVDRLYDFVTAKYSFLVAGALVVGLTVGFSMIFGISLDGNHYRHLRDAWRIGLFTVLSVAVVQVIWDRIRGLIENRRGPLQLSIGLLLLIGSFFIEVRLAIVPHLNG